jgi:hypothetical protein
MVPVSEGAVTMRRQIAAVVCSAVLASTVLAVTQQKTAAQAASVHLVAGPGSGNGARDRQGSSPRTYTSVKDIMESIIDPSADALWSAVGTVADNEGIHDLVPKTAEEWLDVRRAAVRIIEGGNLLLMPGREAASVGTKSEAPGVELEPAQITTLLKKNRKSFNAFAKDLQALGLEALQASDSKNADLLIEVGGRMENVCEGCHQTFWYPPAKPAAARN